MKALLFALAITTSTIATGQATPDLTPIQRPEPAADDRLCYSAENIIAGWTTAQLEECESRRRVLVTNRMARGTEQAQVQPTVVTASPDRPVLSRLLRNDQRITANESIFNEVRPLLSDQEASWLQRYLSQSETMLERFNYVGYSGHGVAIRVGICDREWTNHRLVTREGQNAELAEPATIAQAITIGSALEACQINHQSACEQDCLFNRAIQAGINYVRRGYR